MPPKKKAKRSRSTKTSSASAVAVHATVGQKIGIAVALLAGFAAIAAGFAAIPRGERPARDDGRLPAHNEQRQAQNERTSERRQPAREEARQPEKKKVFFGLFSVKDKSQEKEENKESEEYGELEKPETEQKSDALLAAEVVELSVDAADTSGKLRTGQESFKVLGANMKATGEALKIFKVSFRIKSLGNTPMKEIDGLLRDFELHIDNKPASTTVVSANNGMITFEGLADEIIPKGGVKHFDLYAQPLNAWFLDQSDIGQPFSVELDTTFSPPLMYPWSWNSNAEVKFEGKAESQPYTLSRAELSAFFGLAYPVATPEGFTSKSSEQLIAIVHVPNKSEDGYEAMLEDFAIDINHNVQSSGMTTLKVYKNSIDNSQLLASSEVSWSDINGKFVFQEDSFKDTALAPMASHYVYVTMDTSDPSVNSTTSLCVTLNEQAQWGDGVKTYSTFAHTGGGTKCMMY